MEKQSVKSLIEGITLRIKRGNGFMTAFVNGKKGLVSASPRRCLISEDETKQKESLFHLFRTLPDGTGVGLTVLDTDFVENAVSTLTTANSILWFEPVAIATICEMGMSSLSWVPSGEMRQR